MNEYAKGYNDGVRAAQRDAKYLQSNVTWHIKDEQRMDFQYFWRCRHHPRAMENFYDGEIACGWGCEKNELRWYDNGCSPQTS